MGKNRKKTFRSVDEAFKVFIPDYVSRAFRRPTKEIIEEEKLCTQFAELLVERFKQKINARASRTK